MKEKAAENTGKAKALEARWAWAPFGSLRYVTCKTRKQSQHLSL